jgi:lipopolysaccharide/colanic/teichoic acid biosynthesis glycosyltransferase
VFEAIKRISDIVFSLVLTIVLLPLFLIVIFVLKFTGEGEIIYHQERVGLNNNKFKIIKFATMIKDSPNLLTGSLTTRNDPRVTSIGKYLRKYKINELPQLINVIKGDMSVVGARPQMEVDFLVYPKHIREKIYCFRPGITSLASIIFRDEEALISNSGQDVKSYYANIIAPYKGEVELWYQARRSFFNDLKVIFITFWVIIFPKSKIIERSFKDLPPKTF